jgi:hypothetical protein
MQHVFPYIKPVKIYIMHGLCYHVTHRYAVVNGVHMVIFVSVSRGTKDSFYVWFMHITTYIYACVYRLTRITRDSWLSSAWLTQARVHWADRDLAGASPTNGSSGLSLLYIYIYIHTHQTTESCIISIHIIRWIMKYNFYIKFIWRYTYWYYFL